MIYLINFICGVLGILVLSFVKINNINKRTAKEVKKREILVEYLRSDFPTLIISVICVIIWVIFIDTYIKTGGSSNPIPWVAKSYQELFFRFLNITSFLFGYFGQSLLLSLGGRAEKVLKKIHGDENCPPQ